MRKASRVLPSKNLIKKQSREQTNCFLRLRFSQNLFKQRSGLSRPTSVLWENAGFPDDMGMVKSLVPIAGSHDVGGSLTYWHGSTFKKQQNGFQMTRIFLEQTKNHPKKTHPTLLLLSLLYQFFLDPIFCFLLILIWFVLILFFFLILIPQTVWPH